MVAVFVEIRTGSINTSGKSEVHVDKFKEWHFSVDFRIIYDDAVDEKTAVCEMFSKLESAGIYVASVKTKDSSKSS